MPLPPAMRAKVLSVRFTCLAVPQPLHSMGSDAADMGRSASNFVRHSLQ